MNSMYESIEPIVLREQRAQEEQARVAEATPRFFAVATMKLFIPKTGTALRYYPSEESRDHMMAMVTKDGRVFSVTTKTYFDTATAWGMSLPQDGMIYVNCRNHVDTEYMTARNRAKSLKNAACKAAKMNSKYQLQEQKQLRQQERIHAKLQQLAYKEEARIYRVAQRAAQKAARYQARLEEKKTRAENYLRMMQERRAMRLDKKMAQARVKLEHTHLLLRVRHEEKEERARQRLADKLARMHL